ncbi:MAG TPA: hypothetical protein VKT73_14100 [Xanthobacteraceae bacterium]|nr:hypothetical protein [Xanthobacteraceae bacterium]
MIRNLIVAAAVTAVAVSFAPTASFAKKPKKEARCAVVGSMCTKKFDKVGKVTGWANTKTCYPNHKMYLSTFPCYAPSGMCPPKC